MQPLIVNVTDPDDVLTGYGAGALIRIERDTAATMSGASEIATVAVVASTTEYEYWDTTASPATTYYYRTRYSKASPSVAADYSGYSDIRQVPLTTGTSSPGPVGHSYSNVDQFKAWMVDNGADFGSAQDDKVLTMLLAASRRMDAFCQRSATGQPVFGPALVTRRYDAPRGAHPGRLRLDEDFLSISAVTVVPSFGSTAITYTDETDFIKEPYDTAPYRSLSLVITGASTWYGTRRGISVTGVAGTRNTHERLGLLTAAISSTSATSLTMDTRPSPGHMLYIDSEQLFVRSVNVHESSGYHATVVRGCNGTTAATHLNVAQVDVFVYPAEASECANILTQRALKSRDAGLTGDYGGGPVPVTGNRDTERSVMREHLWMFQIVSA